MKIYAPCRLGAALLLLLLVFGCYPPYRPATVPIGTIRYDAAGGPHQELMVFLPGYGDTPSAVERHGLVRAVWARGLAADIVGVDAHLGYYQNGTILTRLKEDVIAPAKAGGYKHIWLVGTSLGAYGAILYAEHYPQDITGVVLLGPFLGEKKTVDEIRQAGGVRQWDPGEVGDKTKEDWEKKIWLWLKLRQKQDDFRLWSKDCEQEKGCLPIIYLGYGKFDRFSRGQDLLASVLPPEHVVALFGGHDWMTWTRAWDTILDRMIVTKPGGR
jgi:pimeloyl-ACP methyl ester carboxylesterase